MFFTHFSHRNLAAFFIIFIWLLGAQALVAREVTWQEVRQREDLYIAFLSHRAYEKFDAVKNILIEQGEILEIKDLNLSHLGPTNLIYALYFDLCDVQHSWVLKPYRVQKHVDYRFKEGVPSRFVVLSYNELDQAIEAKRNVRNRLCMDTLDIHITDSTQEALYLGDLIFSKGAELFLNNAVRCRLTRYLNTTNKDILIFNKNDFYIVTGNRNIEFYNVYYKNLYFKK